MTAPTRLLAPSRMLLTYKSGLVRYFAFCEGGGLAAYDFSPLLEHGSLLPLASEPTWTADGKLGNALIFDGINDYVLINDADSLTSPIITITYWIHFPSPFAGNVILSKSIFEYEMYVLGLSGGYFNIQGRYADVDNIQYRTTTNNRSLTTDIWYHIAYVYPSKLLYLNGVLASVTQTTVAATRNTTYDLFIGARNATSEFSNQITDEVRIFNLELSAAEIFDEYFSAIRGW